MIYTRQQLEEFESQQLASYATFSKIPKGGNFQRRKRIYVLFPTGSWTHFAHHCLPPAWIQNTGLHQPWGWLLSHPPYTYARSGPGWSLHCSFTWRNEDPVETICLAHDLGHPPFGHSGESALAKIMSNHGGFNHNHQSLRIVTVLENRYPDFRWTWVKLLKGWSYTETDYDRSDVQDYDPELRGSLEAQIANVADELAYTSHDPDDGLRSGWSRLHNWTESPFGKLSTKVLVAAGQKPWMSYPAIRLFADWSTLKLLTWYNPSIVTCARAILNRAWTPKVAL